MILLYEIVDVFYGIYYSIEALFRGTYTEKVISNTWNLFAELWYYVIVGACAAVLITHLMSYKKISGFLRRGGGMSIVCAAVLGVVSPMCTFTAIPLAGGLIATGVPVPPIMAFLIASPLMNPSLFIITWGVMGPHMALIRLFSAFFLALTGGLITQIAHSRGWFSLKHPLSAQFKESGSFGVCSTRGLSSHTLCFGDFLKHSLKMTLFISKYFIMALFIAGAVQAFISPQWIAALLGGSGFKSVLIGGLLGIPLYVCGGGTVALIGVLVSMGMGQGAALAFFITGPATKISTIVSLHAVLRKKIAVVYLAVTLIGGVLFGYGYSRIAPELTMDSKYNGKVEPKENAVMYKPGIGSPADVF